jgi:hypothetical protein
MKLNVHFFWLEMGISHFDASNWVASLGFLIGFTSFVVPWKLYTFLLSFFFFIWMELSFQKVTLQECLLPWIEWITICQVLHTKIFVDFFCRVFEFEWLEAMEMKHICWFVQLLIINTINKPIAHFHIDVFLHCCDLLLRIALLWLHVCVLLLCELLVVMVFLFARNATMNVRSVVTIK